MPKTTRTTRITRTTKAGKPKLRSQAVGQHGENVAARYLQSAGMSVLERNWRGSHGELDVIAIDNNVLVICEVKTRSHDGFGGPLAAVTDAKVQRLRTLAGEWLDSHETHVEGLRIDVIGVSLPDRGPARVEHIVGIEQ